MYSRRLKRDKEFATTVDGLLDNLFPREEERAAVTGGLDSLLERHGFDEVQHDQIREELRSGMLGLSKNRLPASTQISDVKAGDVLDWRADVTAADREAGEAALANGEVAVVTLAAGAASRWTEGAGVVKAMHPFCKFNGRHRSFLEVHLAKSQRVGVESGAYPAHVVTTSYMTHAPISRYLDARDGVWV